MKWATGRNLVDLSPAVKKGIITQRQAVQLTTEQLHGNAVLYQRVVDAWVESIGGSNATFNSPQRAGYRKVAVFRYYNHAINDWDCHWITQHADGQWTGKRGVTPEVVFTSPDAQLAAPAGGYMTGKQLIGVYYIPGRTRTNPVVTARRMAILEYIENRPGIDVQCWPNGPTMREILNSNTTTNVLPRHPQGQYKSLIDELRQGVVPPKQVTIRE